MNDDKKKKAMNAEVTKVLMGENGEAIIWVLQNWKKLAGVIFAILALILIITGINSYRESRFQKGSEAFAAAETIDALRSAIAGYSSHSGVESARIRLAKMLVDEKKYDEALTELAAVNSPAAKLMIGYICELQKKDAEALQAFAVVLNDLQADASSRAEAKYASARILIQQKNLQKAAEMLKMSLPQSAGAMAWEESSRQLLTQLENGDFK